MNSLPISLVTYSGLPDLDPDDQLLKNALARRGFEVKAVVWDAEINWKNMGACILRSTWDYHLKYDKFCSWINQLSHLARVFNSPAQILWNSRKTYLKELSENGLPIIPTVFVSNENRLPLDVVIKKFGWKQAIIKPTVGLATAGVMKIDLPNGLEEGEKHIDELLEKSEVMVQQYFPSVHGYGERALMFINGQYSHCVRKSAFQKLAVAGAAGETAANATKEEIETAEKILSHLDEVPLYARVDLVRDLDNHPVLMELELVEPSLFLKTYPAAAEHFADAIANRLNRSAPEFSPVLN